MRASTWRARFAPRAAPLKRASSYGAYSNGIARIDQPSYSIMNLRVGLNPAGGHWLAELYVRNLTDKNAIIYSNSGNFDLRETTNEPRVIGLRFNYRVGKETNSE